MGTKRLNIRPISRKKVEIRKIERITIIIKMIRMMILEIGYPYIN
jgi:hypothetical protein